MTPINPIEAVARADALEQAPAERSEQKKSAPDVSPEAIKAAVATNQNVVFGGRSIEFAYDEDVSRVIVTVRSDDTEEIVRQIPPEDYVRFISRFRELLGVMFDEVA